MTGDGVNDGPALKQAQVGIAMGIRGTEVAKDAADIILLDDNFASIVKGIEQGRLSSDNLRKSIMYTLCSKLPQFLPTVGSVLGLPAALTITQILAVDIGTDIWTSIAYALQPSESSLMRRAPRHPATEPLVDRNVMLYAYTYMGIMQTLGCVLMFTVFFPKMLELIESGKKYQDYDEDDYKIYAQGTTVYYWSLVVGQIAAAYCTTTFKQTLLDYGIPNTTLNVFVILEILMAVAIIYVPSLQGAVGTYSLPWLQFLLPFVIIFLPIMAIEELRKKWMRNRDSHDEEEENLAVNGAKSPVLSIGIPTNGRGSRRGSSIGSKGAAGSATASLEGRSGGRWRDRKASVQVEVREDEPLSPAPLIATPGSPPNM